MGGRKGVQIQACDVALKPGRNRGQPKAKAKPKRAAMGQPSSKSVPKAEADKELYPNKPKEFQEDAVHSMPPPRAKAKPKAKAKADTSFQVADLSTLNVEALTDVVAQHGPMDDGGPNELSLIHI